MSRFVRASTSLLCALPAVLTFGCLGFPGPNAPPEHWTLASLSIFLAIPALGVWLIPIRPRRIPFEGIRLHGADEPTYVLDSSEGEQSWYLVLGRERVTILNPFQRPEISVDRLWADLAVVLFPKNLLTVPTDSLPGAGDEPHSALRCFRLDLRNWLWEKMGTVHEIDLLFRGHPVLARRIDAYRRRTDSVLGARAIDGLQQLAHRFRASGLIGLLVGIYLAGASLAIFWLAPRWWMHGLQLLVGSALIFMFSGHAFRRSWSYARRAGALTRQEFAPVSNVATAGLPPM